MQRFDADNIHLTHFDMIVDFVNGDLRRVFDGTVAGLMDASVSGEAEAKCEAAILLARRFSDQRFEFDRASTTWMFQNTPVLCALFDALQDREAIETVNEKLVDWSGHRSLLTDLC